MRVICLPKLHQTFESVKSLKILQRQAYLQAMERTKVHQIKSLKKGHKTPN